MPHSPSSFTIIFVSHGVSLSQWSIEVVLVDNYISSQRIYVVVFIFLFHSFLFCFLFPSLIFYVYLFSLTFFLRYDTIKVQTPSTSRSDMRQVYRVLYHTSYYNMHNIFFKFLCVASFYHFFDNLTITRYENVIFTHVKNYNYYYYSMLILCVFPISTYYR